MNQFLINDIIIDMSQEIGGELSIWTGDVADPDKWRERRIGIGITAPCPAFCRFCERNQDLRKGLGTINFPKDELVKNIIEAVGGKKGQVEFVLTGGIVGEPLLKGVHYLKGIITTVKSTYPDSTIRLNTIGNILNLQQSETLINELKEAGLDRVAISLNATNKQDYDYLCRPKEEGNFENALEFIEASLKILGSENTIVSFVNYDDHPKAPSDWPIFSKEKANELLLPMGVSKDNIILRDYIPVGKNK